MTPLEEQELRKKLPTQEERQRASIMMDKMMTSFNEWNVYYRSNGGTSVQMYMYLRKFKEAKKNADAYLNLFPLFRFDPDKKAIDWKNRIVPQEGTSFEVCIGVFTLRHTFENDHQAAFECANEIADTLRKYKINSDVSVISSDNVRYPIKEPLMTLNEFAKSGTFFSMNDSDLPAEIIIDELPSDTIFRIYHDNYWMHAHIVEDRIVWYVEIGNESHKGSLRDMEQKLYEHWISNQ